MNVFSTRHSAGPAAIGSALGLSSLAGARTINGLGDSRTQMSIYSPTAGVAIASNTVYTSKAARSFLAQAEALSGGLLDFDMAKGYGGPLQGLLKVIVVAGGSGYTNPTVSFTPGGATGTVQVQNGAITGVTVTNPGSTNLSIGFTLSDPTGTGAVLSVVSSGHGTFGVNGSTTAGMVARLPDVLANPPDICTVLGGYNDILGNVPYATIVANLRTCYETLMAAGICVVPIVEPGESTLTAPQRQMLDRVRRWTRLYAQRLAAVNPQRFRLLSLADPTPYTVDAATTAGTCYAPDFIDGVHPSQSGAKTIGSAVWLACQKWVGQPQAAFPISRSHADGFDSVLNPGGYVTVYSASPGFVGTDQAATATVGSVNVTGTRAQDWLLGRNTGSAAGSMVCSIESPFSDGRPGRRQIIAASLGSGSAAEQWAFATGSRPYAACGAVGGSGNQLLKLADIDPASLFHVVADLELANIQNLTKLFVYVFDSTLGSVPQYRAGADLGGQKVYASADRLPVTRLQFRTQPMALHANIGNLGYGLQFEFDASGAAGSATATIKINTLRLSKAEQS